MRLFGVQPSRWRISTSLGLLLLPILSFSCTSAAPAQRNADSQATYVPPKGMAYVSMDFTGQLLVTAPLWLGAERGDRPHIFLSADPEQVKNLRQQFRWIVVGIGGVKSPTHLPDWEKMAWDLDQDPFQRATRLYPFNPSYGEPRRWEDLFPIHVEGVDRAGKATLILAVPLR